MRRNKLSIRLLFQVVLITFILGVNAAEAVLIDFDTRADGTPYVGQGEIFSDDEYSAMGVLIHDGEIVPDQTWVFLNHPANTSTSISNYYMGIGAFAGLPTYVDINFMDPTSEVSFDFATFSGDVIVSVYGLGGTFLGDYNFLGTGNFLTQAGYNINEGSAVISGIGQLDSIRISALPNQGLFVDNLSFNQCSQTIPEPATIILFGASIAGVLGLRKREKVS